MRVIETPVESVFRGPVTNRVPAPALAVAGTEKRSCMSLRNVGVMVVSPA